MQESALFTSVADVEGVSMTLPNFTGMRSLYILSAIPGRANQAFLGASQNIREHLLDLSPIYRRAANACQSPDIS